MTIAAIYARFSSDSQREESIEIQVEQCLAYIERRGWSVGEIFTDYARSGTNDKRPDFQRAIAAGEAHEYDVLVYLKNDRFARNVEDSRRYKRRLKNAGCRLVSVREGESEDDPVSFLHEGLDELFAEYYSRNLAVLVRDGIQKNAENCKASGIRIYGYDVDATDHFVPNPYQSEIVREIFSSYVAGASVNDIANLLNERDVPAPRGDKWIPKSIAKMLHKDAYIGVYRYAGVVNEGGMPALVDKGVFAEAQQICEYRQRKKRKAVVNNYLLTNKLYCLKCGSTMQGQAGTSGTGKKYTYYACVSKTGCGLRIPSEVLEDVVLGAVRSLLTDDDSIAAMVEAVRDYANSLPDNSALYQEQLNDALKRQNNLIKSIEEGIPVSAIKDALAALDETIKDLKMKVAREDFYKSNRLTDDEIRDFFVRYITKEGNSEFDQLLIDSFVDNMYVDEDCVMIAFHVDGDEQRYSIEELQALKNSETGSDTRSEPVRTCELWWRRGESNSGPEHIHNLRLYKLSW